VIDSGIDFRHPDFIGKDATGQPVSRLLYFWDTMDGSGARSGPRPPAVDPDGAPFGRIYTRDELTAELRRPNGLLPTPAANGHGTACAGIAAGNGLAADGRYNADFRSPPNLLIRPPLVVASF